MITGRSRRPGQPAMRPKPNSACSGCRRPWIAAPPRRGEGMGDAVAAVCHHDVDARIVPRRIADEGQAVVGFGKRAGPAEGQLRPAVRCQLAPPGDQFFHLARQHGGAPGGQVEAVVLAATGVVHAHAAPVQLAEHQADETARIEPARARRPQRQRRVDAEVLAHGGAVQRLYRQAVPLARPVLALQRRHVSPPAGEIQKAAGAQAHRHAHLGDDAAGQRVDRLVAGPAGTSGCFAAALDQLHQRRVDLVLRRRCPSPLRGGRSLRVHACLGQRMGDQIAGDARADHRGLASRVDREGREVVDQSVAERPPRVAALGAHRRSVPMAAVKAASRSTACAPPAKMAGTVHC